jgi:plasmid stability protein
MNDLDCGFAPLGKGRTMADLVLTDVNDGVLHELRERATIHQRTPEDEAKAILSDVLGSKGRNGWERVDEIFNRLAASGRTFTDSADLLHEDRVR